MQIPLPGRNLIVTAHPDDSFIWANNLRELFQSNWTDVVATHTRFSARGKEFIAACNVLKSTPKFLGLEDDPYTKLDLLPLQYNLKLPRYANVFTHNPNGEYGHQHHKDVHSKLVYEIGMGSMCGYLTPNLWVFDLNYQLPDLVIHNFNKKHSPCMGIYEREMYIMQFFNMLSEGFCLVSEGTSPLAKSTLDILMPTCPQVFNIS